MKVTYVPPPVVSSKIVLELDENEAGLLRHFADYYDGAAHPTGVAAARRLRDKLNKDWKWVDSTKAFLD